jgi:hypothetical protein
MMLNESVDPTNAENDSVVKVNAKNPPEDGASSPATRADLGKLKIPALAWLYDRTVDCFGEGEANGPKVLMRITFQLHEVMVRFCLVDHPMATTSWTEFSDYLDTVQENAAELVTLLGPNPNRNLILEAIFGSGAMANPIISEKLFTGRLSDYSKFPLDDRLSEGPIDIDELDDVELAKISWDGLRKQLKLVQRAVEKTRTFIDGYNPGGSSDVNAARYLVKRLGYVYDVYKSLELNNEVCDDERSIDIAIDRANFVAEVLAHFKTEKLMIRTALPDLKRQYDETEVLKLLGMKFTPFKVST